MNCYDCKEPIEANDDAGVCIQCGGMNRRLWKSPFIHGLYQGLAFALLVGGLFALAYLVN